MKTPKEFDYDLWTTEDEKCFMRVKRTGEECEINRETMRLLQSEAKRIQREQQGIPIYKVQDGRYMVSEHATALSLDAYTDDVPAEGAGGVTSSCLEDTVATSMLEESFRATLTQKQCDVYIQCLLNGMTLRAYATANGIDYSSVHECVRGIRKKAKNFFPEYPHKSSPNVLCILKG